MLKLARRFNPFDMARQAVQISDTGYPVRHVKVSPYHRRPDGYMIDREGVPAARLRP